MWNILFFWTLNYILSLSSISFKIDKDTIIWTWNILSILNHFFGGGLIPFWKISNGKCNRCHQYIYYWWKYMPILARIHGLKWIEKLCFWFPHVHDYVHVFDHRHNLLRCMITYVLMSVTMKNKILELWRIQLILRYLSFKRTA